jgi:hypothetical protein
MRCALLILFISLVVFAEEAAGQCKNVYPYELDVGLYVARLQMDMSLKFDKYCRDDPNSLSDAYDPNGNTVIIFHGLQPELLLIHGNDTSVRFGYQADFGEMLAGWFHVGWNVLFYQWTQLADEPLINFEHATDKIHTSRSFNGMQYTYLTRGGDVKVGDASRKESVMEMALWDIISLPVPTVSGRELRLVGHSLGVQLALGVAYEMHSLHLVNSTAVVVLQLPKRVVLLDPVFSSGAKAYFTTNKCGSRVSDVMGCQAEALKSMRVAIEYYRTSFINRCLFSSEDNGKLIENSAFAHVDMYAWGDHPLGSCYDPGLLYNNGKLSSLNKINGRMSNLTTQIAEQHRAAIPYYFLSLSHPPHRCAPNLRKAGVVEHVKAALITNCTASNTLALSAAMKTSQVLSWASVYDSEGYKQCFHQYDDGTRTPTSPTMTTFYAYDDTYYLTACKWVNS